MVLGRARARGAVIVGVRGQLVDVEVDVSQGLPAVSIVGLPDASVSEARHRVRCAVESAGLDWPLHRVTVSLTPAEVRKSGSGLDLPIAIGILAASGQLQGAQLDDCALVAELGLDGRLLPAAGALAMIVAARDAGLRRAVVAGQALDALVHVPGIDVLPAATLRSLVDHLCGGTQLSPALHAPVPEPTAEADLSDVRGHQDSLLALEVAAAGAHHVAVIGPPGVGKSMLATRMPGLLPDLTEAQALETAAIASVAGLDPPGRRPPVAAPHHSASAASVLGSVRGSRVAPGAVTLAHLGCLVLDEAAEFARPSLEGLRQPLETGLIALQRAGWAGRLPARFQLVMTANPCPCGRRNGSGVGCTCTSMAVRRYRSKLSGPLMDRIDVRLGIDKPSPAQAARPIAESSAVVRERVVVARERAAERFAAEAWSTNADIPPRALRARYSPDAAGADLLEALSRDQSGLRGPDRILRMAWTLADLRGADRPGRDDVAVAMALRTSWESR